MSNSNVLQHSGHVGQRGAIVLPSEVRQRYGLKDGSLFVSEEREDGILIRPAVATPINLTEIRNKIQRGLDELDRGEGIPGDQAEEDLKSLSWAYRARKSR